jgi:hypothetical protein
VSRPALLRRCPRRPAPAARAARTARPARTAPALLGASLAAASLTAATLVGGAVAPAAAVIDHRPCVTPAEYRAVDAAIPADVTTIARGERVRAVERMFDAPGMDVTAPGQRGQVLRWTACRGDLDYVVVQFRGGRAAVKWGYDGSPLGTAVHLRRVLRTTAGDARVSAQVLTDDPRVRVRPVAGAVVRGWIERSTLPACQRGEECGVVEVTRRALPATVTDPDGVARLVVPRDPCSAWDTVRRSGETRAALVLTLDYDGYVAATATWRPGQPPAVLRCAVG